MQSFNLFLSWSAATLGYTSPVLSSNLCDTKSKEWVTFRRNELHISPSRVPPRSPPPAPSFRLLPIWLAALQRKEMHWKQDCPSWLGEAKSNWSKAQWGRSSQTSTLFPLRKHFSVKFNYEKIRRHQPNTLVLREEGAGESCSNQGLGKGSATQRSTTGMSADPCGGLRHTRISWQYG